ncbi:hypothetical protein AALO_G00187080 [Alosa alosa]|uniref:CDT1 Geminin-binding domain-containing protein n=1 Tax=Alosa alosa TaxID=278164 RepID=A0AAV6G8V7_9TELE|nr:DNA replication factor Cdt1 [Alosa alosa]KAG5269961.1 hypothetical protein AALO_G00187080 [Alosa alosa]
MAQARVTDYFAQSKRGGIERGARNKGQKPAVHNADNVIAKTRSTRQHNRTSGRSRVTKSTSSCVQEEFLRVINEAVSTKNDGRSKETRNTEDGKQDILASPQTPKRTSTEAEFDLGSAVFSSTAEHSSAKKRLRVGSSQEVNPVAEKTEVKISKRTARKRLILSKDGDQEKAADSVKEPSSQPPVPEGVDKQSKNVVNHTSSSSPSAQSPPKSTVRSKKPLSKGDVAALKTRLLKLKGQAESVVTPSPAPESSLAELKARLDRARELTAKVQQQKEKREAEAKPAEVETQPESDGEKTPAYQRYHTLAQDVPPGLTLPYKYKVLAEMFRSMDTIVSILFNRTETVTFAKVKQGVQDMMHKRFEESHVGQIKTVYPIAYKYRQERNIPTFSSTVKKSSYQLTMEPVIEEQSSTRPILTASCLLERRRTFNHNLVNIVKEHHKSFLQSLDPPVVVPDDMLTRWHPRFRVDEVPNVQPSDLPQPPQTEKLTTAQEVLDKARALMTPKMEKALANMALKTAETACAKEAEAPTPKEAAPLAATPSALKGVSQSLLERIRAKEAQKLQAAMTRNPQQEERLAMMSRLGELARILRNVFVAEKKPALIMEVACNRMIASYRSALSQGDMEKHIRLLAELTPNWLTIHPIRKDLYLKLNKTMDLSVVQDKLSQKIKEEERR